MTSSLFEGSARILYATPFDLSLVTGPAVNETEFCAALLERFGDSVSLVLPRPANADAGLPPAVFTRGHRGYHPVHYLRNEVDQARVLHRLLSTGEYDFLVFRLGILPLGAWRAVRRHAVPYAIKTLSIGAFDAFHMRSGVQGLIGPALAPWNERLYRDLIRGATAVDTCTDADVAFFSARFDFAPGQLRKVENATNVTRFQPRPAAEARQEVGLGRFEPVVGYAGGRPSTRGAAQMVEIAPALRERFPNLGIVIVGDGDGVPELRERARALGVSDCVVFVGVVPYQRVSTYVSTFDVGFSFDLKSNTDRIGNSSQKVLQYVAAGLPVVSGPGGNEFLETEGLGTIREADDLDGIRDATLRWLTLSEAERAALCERATRYAREHLSVEARLQERVEFWTEQLGRSGGG